MRVVWWWGCEDSVEVVTSVVWRWGCEGSGGGHVRITCGGEDVREVWRWRCEGSVEVKM